MMCLNSAKVIGCTVVNIGTQDLVEGRNIFLQKMCYCAETTMKLSGRRSSELSYIELDQSDWSFKRSIVCRKSCSSLGNSTAASVIHVLRSIFVFFSWVFDKSFTN